MFAALVASVVGAPSVPAAERSAAEREELLVAAGAPADGVVADRTLTSEQLNAAADQARSDWQSSLPDADLSSVTVVVADLAGLELGRTVGDTIEIDADAAGYG